MKQAIERKAQHMRASSRTVLVPVLLLTLLALGGCAVLPTDDPSEPEQARKLTIVDTTGRIVEFPAAPKRIVVAGRAVLPLVNTMYLFPEAPERVIAVTSGNQKPGDFLTLVSPEFGETTLLGPDAGPEQIAPLKPDLVVMRSFMGEKLGEPLEQIDIPVVYMDMETPERYFQDLGNIGQLFGNSARVEEIEAFYRGQMERIDLVVEGLSDEAKPRILILQYSDKGGEVALNVPPASWIQTMEAEMAGAVPAWAEAAQGGGWTVVNFEQIAAWDADKVFVIDYKGDSAQVVERLRADPQWQALKAVKEEEIYGFPADVFSWDQPDPRWILGLTWLATRAHPDRFTGVEMGQEAARFFQEMYGMDPSSFQEQIVPTFRGDLE